MTPDALSGWIQRVFGNPRPKPPTPDEVRERATPLTRDRAIAIGRLGGPAFLESEIARRHHLAALVK